MTETLQCLKRHGQRLDLEIAKEMRVPLVTVRQHLTALAERREAIICKTIQFEKGRPFEAWQAVQHKIRQTTWMSYPDGSPVPEFLLHIDGSEAWWRWSNEPFDRPADAAPP